MIDMKKIPYKVDHLDLFEIDDLEYVEHCKNATYQKDNALTIMVDGRPICAIGMRLHNEVTGEVWLIKSKHLKKYKHFFVRELEIIIEEYVEKYKLRRLQTVISDNYVKWIEFMGFERESEMINFVPNKKTYIYRRLFNGN